MDNVFIERLWWSLKYECIYLQECARTGKDQARGADAGQGAQRGGKNK